jgi:FlaA1/EpsC-like NDP-sugar epimerase
MGRRDTAQGGLLASRRRIGIITHDISIIAVAWLLAYLIRYDFHMTPASWEAFWRTLPVVMTIQALIFWRFGLYRGLWRFASVPDLWNIIRAAFLGILIAAVSLYLYNRLQGVPRTVIGIYPFLLVLLLGTPRLIYRMWREHGLGLMNHANSKRVLIIGAGRSGEMLARDMRRDALYAPIGFLDDQDTLKGSNVHGIPVLGMIDRLPDIAERLRPDLVIIAMPSATNAEMRRVVGICERAGVQFRTLPRLQDLASGEPLVSELREVNIEDLLGRDPVVLDWPSISDGLIGRTVLVSGAGGSIGSELCRQIARLRPAALVLFENNEFNLFRIETELRAKHPSLALHASLGDVRDRISVAQVFEKFRPEIVFHAAAYKHVPMLEFQASEAVRNNVFGTQVVAQAADRFGCATFVMISTDKAVNPTNVMGATKRIAEVYCQSLSRLSKTRFITVRFGNVLGSTGSVVPLFQEQIRMGGPVTVTHPEITRYFMTTSEAAQLIMQAAVMGQGGEIFVLDMGEPVPITYLAEQMIRLSGKIPNKDIPIVYTSLRPGEKLVEELFYDDEQRIRTGHSKILLAHGLELNREMFTEDLRALEEAGENHDEKGVRSLLKKIVPALETRDPVKAEIGKVVALNRSKP